MRQYIATQPLNQGLLIVSGKDFRYLRKVLRLKTGDMLAVRLQDGTVCNATICAVDDTAGRITIQPAARTEQNPVSANRVSWWLFQIVPQPKKMELIVRQAVECGVSYIVPVAGEFSQKSSIEALQKDNARNNRFSRIIKEARQQSGSPIDTRILPLCNMEQALKLWQETVAKDKAFAVVLYEQTAGTSGAHCAAALNKAIMHGAVFCGCEGGISPQEIATLRDAGVVPVHFRTNILRCETAALYGMAVLQALITEQDEWQLKE